MQSIEFDSHRMWRVATAMLAGMLCGVSLCAAQGLQDYASPRLEQWFKLS